MFPSSTVSSQLVSYLFFSSLCLALVSPHMDLALYLCFSCVSPIKARLLFKHLGPPLTLHTACPLDRDIIFLAQSILSVNVLYFNVLTNLSKSVLQILSFLLSEQISVFTKMSHVILWVSTTHSLTHSRHI